MRIPLDDQCTVPLYQQIETYLRQNIESGKLLPDTRLPASRQLAQQLGVSRITVTNAYAELESEGLIYSREGSGTYVAPPIPSATSLPHQANISWPLWQHDLETSADLPQPFRPDQISQQTVHPEPIIFSGVGDPRQFPIKDFNKAMQTVIRRDGTAAFKYGGFDGGYRPLRQTLSHVLAAQGIQATADNTLITAGSQQAIALVCQLLLKSGDVVLVEKPSYNLALELFRTCQLKIIDIPIDEQGMQVEQVETVLQQYRPKLLYTMPNFHNPTGVCLSGSRRRMLIQLAERYNVPILEDDFVGDLRYNGRVQPTIKALDQSGTVIYIGTFSKMLMPGLRAGYLVADGPVFDRLVSYKRVNDLTSSTLMQRTLEEYVTIGRYQTHLRRSCRIYRKRRDAMITAIKQHLPTVRFISPQGGLFIWLKLPDDLSSLALLPLAMQEGVGFSPGRNFFIHQTEGDRYLRLNFATQTSENIETGIRRLAMAITHL